MEAILTKCNFISAKLFRHGYKFLNAILTEMNPQQKEHIIYLIFWDRRINVILFDVSFVLLRGTMGLSDLNPNAWLNMEWGLNFR